MELLIKDFEEGNPIRGQFALTGVQRGTTNTSGKPYLRLTLKDSSGVITGFKWNVYDEDYDICQNGAVVLVSGIVKSHSSGLQLTIDDIQSVAEKDIDPNRFIKQCPVDVDVLIKKLDDHVASIKDVDLHTLVESIVRKYRDKLITYPAAVSVHHDFQSGLLCHTLSMTKIAEFMASHYYNVDHDLLISGCLLHDIGKTIEFEGTTSYHYSLEGKLLGHISIMATIIDEEAKALGTNPEKALLLKHMILSHHGEYEYGSPVLPQTREAILLNLIDNLDSKMAIVDKALEDVAPGELSQKVFALDNRVLYKAK